MKINVLKLYKQHKYSEGYKKNIVADFESRKFGVSQLERLHGIGNPTIYSWKHKLYTFNEKGFRIVEMKDRNIKKKRVKSLSKDSAVGRKQIMIDYL